MTTATATRARGLDEGWIVLATGFAALLAYSLTTTGLHSAHLKPVWALDVVLHLLRDLGIAFIVGGVVSLGIERVSRSRLQREIKSEIKDIQRNVINSAYLKNYPAGYTSVVEDTLKTEVFCRIGLTVDVDLQLPNESGATEFTSDCLILMDQISTGRVRNVSNAPQLFQPTVFLGKDWDLKTPELLAWKIGIKELTPEDIVAADESVEDSLFTKWYKFPTPVLLQPNEEVYTYSKIRNYKRARDVTTWCGLLATDGLRFSVTHPPQFEVFVQGKCRNRGNAYPLTSDGRRVTLEVFNGTPPYTTVELGWRPMPKPEEGAALPADAPSPILKKRGEK